MNRIAVGHDSDMCREGSQLIKQRCKNKQAQQRNDHTESMSPLAKCQQGADGTDRSGDEAQPTRHLRLNHRDQTDDKEKQGRPLYRPYPLQLRPLFDAAEEEFGGVDVVVHTAGIMPLAPIAELDLETFDRVQRTNVRGTVVVDQLAARRLREGGAIINFSTSVTRLQIPGYGAYAASKGAVEAITLILARELRGRDVTVNAVAPGPTATPLFFEGKTQQMIDQIANTNPMERLGTPDDIAEMVTFLAGPGRWVNGQVLYVNGGAA